MTREELAEAIELDTGYLGMCERGERQLGLNKTIDIIEYFSLMPDDILPSSVKPNPKKQKALIDEINNKLPELSEKQLVVISRIADIIDTL
jgi:hypothetical protein